MKIVVAMDSFKGSLSSLEAGQAIKDAINNRHKVIVKPLADGGEGTVETLVSFKNGRIVNLTTSNPLMKPVSSFYGIFDNNTAIIEMASTCGLTLLTKEERNPMYTSTYGVGEMIKDAINKGCTNFIIGIGGSATNDAGVGMLQALGFSFQDKDNNEISSGCIGLKDLDHISYDNVLKQLNNCTFNIACDVNNPLFGINGASYIFGPQKGADKNMVETMDKYIKHFESITKKSLKSDPEYPGCGAAGGLGYAFLTFLNSNLKSGIELILEEINLEDDIKNCDLVICGEGKLDYQTIMGKAPIGVAKLAKKYNKPVIAFSGVVSDDADIINTNGIDAFFPITRNIVPLDIAMNKEVAYNNLKKTVNQVINLIDIFQK